jgi:hypothetical protein
MGNVATDHQQISRQSGLIAQITESNKTQQSPQNMPE